MCNKKCSYYLTLVRHGETSANKLLIIQGQQDTSLSDVGIAQAELLGQSTMKQQKFDKVYASDLKRAYNTAEIILKHNEATHTPIITDTRIREKCFGSLENRPLSEFQQLAAAAGVVPLDYTPEGGESPTQLRERCKAFIKDISYCIRDEWSDCGALCNVLVATHGGVKRDMLAYFTQECHMISHVSVNTVSPNTGVTKLALTVDEEDNITVDQVITIFNVDHLKEQAAEARANVTSYTAP